MDEYDFGREYGLQAVADVEFERVDIDAMATGSVDIPPGDYQAMRDSGIEQPDARQYWRGYNSAM